MAAAITFVVFLIVAGVLMLRLVRAREENPDFERPERRRRMSSRERKLAKLREFEESMPARPTIQELVHAEAEATGVMTVPGSDGIEVPVLLKVWQRDERARIDCAPGALRYVVREGVEAAEATEDEVMLVCDRPVRTDSEPDATTDPPDGDSTTV